MFRHLHLTRRQWFSILRWSMYGLLFLLTVVFESVILTRLPVFGVKLHIVPILLVCVCIREGPEKGGLFVLLAALFWALSGVDMGSLSLLAVTVCAVLSAVLCRTVLVEHFLSTALCCLLTTLANESVVFGFKLILSRIDPGNYVRVLLPGVGLSMLGFPLAYLLVRAIARIGGGHDL